MREPEGIETPPQGKSSERTWSKHREPYIRNVEAEGSSPFTSTKGPGQRAKVESLEDQLLRRVLMCLYRSHEERHMRSESGPCGDLISVLKTTLGRQRQQSRRRDRGPDLTA